MSSYQGDFINESIIRFFFNTTKSTGEPITFAGSPALAVYKDGVTVESTAGLTLTVNFDSRTGLHSVAIDTNADGAFYAPGSSYHVVVSAGTVDGLSVVGICVGSFSIQNRNNLADVRNWVGNSLTGAVAGGMPLVELGGSALLLIQAK